MKKICITLGLIFIIILTIVLGAGSATAENKEYLRIHIRANSNSEEDQNIKYEIRDVVVTYLTPFIAKCETKEQAEQMLLSQKANLEYIINSFLSDSGFNYKSDVSLKNEKFPTRVYEDETLEAGYYDAVIIGLGTATGDNWWCVIYPPLCFTSGENITYRSKILEIIRKFKNGNN